MRTLMFCVCLASFGMTLHAQDFCSLAVKVVTVSGNEVGDTRPVTVEESDGRIVEKRYDFGGARFCDLGISPVTVTVGFPRNCGQVVVRNIPLDWGKTTTVTVVDNYEPCELYHPGRVNYCSVVYRFRDSQKRPIKGVSLRLHSPYTETFVADEFGRILVRFNYRRELVGTATASGYNPAGVRLTCTSEYTRADQFVTMIEAR